MKYEHELAAREHLAREESREINQGNKERAALRAFDSQGSPLCRRKKDALATAGAWGRRS